MDRFRVLVLAGAASWCLLIIAAPLFQLHTVYVFFSTICHQNPLRSWTLAGKALPVCIRCSCIYLGFLLGTLFSTRTNFVLLQIAAALSVGEFILARVLIDSAWLRAASGLFLGFAAAPFVKLGIEQMVRMRLRRGAV